MKIRAIKCKICKSIIYSRALHDMRWCKCKSCAIDGGRDYTSISYKNKDVFENIELEVKTTEKELYDDWNKGSNIYGLIQGE